MLDDSRDCSSSEDDEDDEDEAVEVEVEVDIYKKKYSLLLERCDAIRQDNERLASRIFEVRRLVKNGLKERKFLVDRLDSYGDNFRNVPIIIPPPGESKIKVEDPVPFSSSQTGSGGGDTVNKRGPKKAKKTTTLSNNGDNNDGSPPKKKKRAKAEPRDPNCPKRPQNPFFQFCQEMRSEVNNEYTDLHNVSLSKKELTKVLANKWNEMDTQQKRIYYSMYEEEKVKYNEKLQKYKDELKMTPKIAKLEMGEF